MPGQPLLKRREAVRQLALLAAGVLASGCAPLHVGLRLQATAFDQRREAADRILRAFVATLIPGVDVDDPNTVRAFHDSFYPLAEYVDILVADLCCRAHRHFGNGAFDQLTIEQRTRVIQDGLAADHTTARLYNGAIFLAQVAVYGGIYDDDRGSPLIGFEGSYQFRGLDAITYPDPARFLPHELTCDGNPV
jgi:hypothetical protein